MSLFSAYVHKKMPLVVDESVVWACVCVCGGGELSGATAWVTVSVCLQICRETALSRAQECASLVHRVQEEQSQRAVLLRKLEERQVLCHSWERRVMAAQRSLEQAERGKQVLLGWSEEHRARAERTQQWLAQCQEECQARGAELLLLKQTVLEVWMRPSCLMVLSCLHSPSEHHVVCLVGCPCML